MWTFAELLRQCTSSGPDVSRGRSGVSAVPAVSRGGSATPGGGTAGATGAGGGGAFHAPRASGDR